MYIRKADLKDLDGIMEVYEKARGLMKAQGNFSQWKFGYPSRDHLTEDIKNGNCYLCINGDNDEEMLGVFVLTGPEKSYENIYDGEWLNDEPHRILHRIGSTGAKKGVGQFCIDWSVKEFKNIKIDTHEANKVMQIILDKLGFTRCGYITSDVDGTPRIAYQKIHEEE